MSGGTLFSSEYCPGGQYSRGDIIHSDNVTLTFGGVEYEFGGVEYWTGLLECHAHKYTICSICYDYKLDLKGWQGSSNHHLVYLASHDVRLRLLVLSQQSETHLYS